MLDISARFERLMQEHEAIQANIRLISGLVDDLNALSNLKESFTDLSQYQVNYLRDKQLNLKRAITSLKDGLLEHYSREEDLMRPLVGSPLMRAIKRENRDTLERLSDIDWILLNTGPAGILFNSTFLENKIDLACQRLYSNCQKNNSVLELLIQAPESQESPK